MESNPLPKPIAAKCIETGAGNSHLPHPLKLNKPYLIVARDGDFVMIKYPNPPEGWADKPIFHKSHFYIKEST
jgi:hypothetical protein